MSPHLRSLTRYLWVLLILGFGAAPELKAGFINGSFDDALNGWTPSEFEFVIVSAGTATLQETPNAAEVTLSQQFLIDADATVLSFKILAIGYGAFPLGFTADAFGVSLLHPTTEAPLTPLALGSTDSYYIRDLYDGVPNGEAADGVTIDDLGAGHYRVNIGVSSLRGQEAILRFRLIGSGDLISDASITIDDVTLAREGGGPTPEVSAVPGPTGFVLCFSGIPLVLFFRRFVR